MSLSGLPRLPGDDNFPATGSSWPGSRRAPSPGSRRWPCRPDGGWRRRQRVPGGPTGRPGGLRGPGAGEWKGSEEGAQAGPLTGAAGVVAASGSSAPGAGARSPPAPPPPPAAASAQWLGLGLGGSPESGLSRTPSPFFFVSTSSGTSCRLSRPTMAVRAAGPGPLPAGRPPCPLPAARSPQPARRPGLQPAGLLAPPPAPPRPPAGPTRPPAVAEPPGPAPGAAALPLCAASSSACPERRIPGEGVPGPNPCSAQPAAPPQADTRPRSHWASRTPCPPYPGPAGANTPSPGVGGQPEESPGPQRPWGPAEPREQTTGNY